MKKVIMKRVVLILFLVLLVPNGNLLLQEIPDCCCVPFSYPPHNINYKIDSSFVFDTCGIKFKSTDCDTSLWINYFVIEDGRERLYAKKGWVVWFDVKAFNLPPYNQDTIIEVSWRDADSINFPEIKDSLKKIEQAFGKYVLVKNDPQYTEPIVGQAFTIYFENYVNGVTIENKIRLIPYTHGDFMVGLSKVDINEDFENKDVKEDFVIFPNPANDYIEINFERCPTSVRCRTSEIIEIYNVLGEKVKSSIPNTLNPNPQFRVDISDLPVGIYFVKVGNIYQSFVKM